MEIPVVILAGGLGTRISKISRGKPKALIEVLGQPFLYWKIHELIDQGVKEIFILGHHGGDQIKEFLKEFDSKSTKVTLIIASGDELLGTGGSICDALEKLPPVFILTYGDNLLLQELPEIVQKYMEYGIPNMLVVTAIINSEEKYNSTISRNKVIDYSKDVSKHVQHNFLDYGYSIWRSSTFEHYQNSKTPLDLSIIFKDIANAGLLSGFITSSHYFEIGTESGLRRTEEWLLKRNH